ncbi:ATP-binding cassette domain-containing protein [Streptomyces sp. NPDC037389]|uniref:ABC transporter ATP-binding protein n=1 Tax=Streptomyces sp. NPDC037389 TaxID=3155369 RepID=UPI0033FF9E7E
MTTTPRRGAGHGDPAPERTGLVRDVAESTPGAADSAAVATGSAPDARGAVGSVPASTDSAPDGAESAADTADGTAPGPGAGDAPVVADVAGLEVRIPDGPVLLAPAGLTLRRGRITVLTGPSGSGKTTLLRAVLGDLPPGARVTRGSVRVLGQDVFALTPARLRELRRHRLAFVGQDPGSGLNPRMRVRDLVAELATGASPADVRKLLAECRLSVDDGLPDRRPAALSGGQQRRVALARALARTPDVLLLDEPTAGLDPALRDEIADLLRHVATDRHIAVALACHDPELAARCADDVVDLGTNTLGAAPPRGPVRRPAPQAAPGSGGPLPTPPPRPGGEPSAPRTGLVARGVRVTFAAPAPVPTPTRGSATTHRHALDGVDFAVAPGTVAAIVGPSGSGKTTLLRVLAGLRPADDGELTLDGAPLPTRVRARGRDERRRIQLVPQNPLGALNPARTIGASLARPLRLHRIVPREKTAERVAELLRDVGLPPEYARRHPHELSGGQRQRASIARALAPRPDVLLCDEVTSALDPATAVAVMELLARLRAERGLALALVSHEPHLVAAYADTVLFLAEGRVAPPD